MSDQRVLDRLKITQNMRFYWYEYKMPRPFPEEIISHSTNFARDSIDPRNRIAMQIVGAVRSCI